MKTIQELVPLIQEWAKERKIYEELTPFDELLKTHEEVGELIKACYDNDKSAIQDAIGDTMVCLINYCYFKNMDFIFHYEKIYPMEAPNNITQTTFAISANNILSELFEAEYEQDELYLYSYLIEHILNGLQCIALSEDTTLEACLNLAYNEIKNRTGKMINGKFVKDEKYTFCKIFDLEDKQILIRKDYCEEDRYKIKVSTFNGEILSSFSFGYIKEEEADECFDSMTVEEILRYLKNIDTKETKDEK